MEKNKKYGIFIFLSLILPLAFLGYLVFNGIKSGGDGHYKKLSSKPIKPLEVKKRAGLFDNNQSPESSEPANSQMANNESAENEYYTTDKNVYNAKEDNSVYQVRKYIQKHIFEPNSFFALEWSRVLKLANGNFIVRCKYRYKEKNNYSLKNEVFTLNSEGKVLSAESYGDFQKKMKDIKVP